jgi:hypothetical protein
MALSRCRSIVLTVHRRRSGAAPRQCFHGLYVPVVSAEAGPGGALSTTSSEQRQHNVPEYWSASTARVVHGRRGVWQTVTVARLLSLVSIGYEGRNLDELIEDLLEQQVNVLVDVRLNPISRKPGLSKQQLAEALACVGIRYVHHRELGNPRDNRSAFRGGEHASRERFRALLAGQPAEMALEHVSELMDGGVVALLCFERDHSQCHRGLVAEALITTEPCVRIVTV